MIKSKEELSYYLKADKFALGIKKISWNNRRNLEISDRLKACRVLQKHHPINTQQNNA